MYLSTTLLLWGAALLAPAQDSHARAELFVRPAPAAATPGEVRAAIRVRIDPGWHLYHSQLGQPDSVGKPTRVSFEGVPGEWSEVRFPQPKRSEQPGLGEDGRDTWIWAHSGTIVLYAAGRLAEGSDPAGVMVQLSGQTCEDGGVCLLYSERAERERRGSGHPVRGLPGRPAGAGRLRRVRVDARAAHHPVEYVLRDEPAQAGERPEGETAAGEEELYDPLGLLGGQGFPSDDGPKAAAKLFVRREKGLVRAAIEIRIEPLWHLYHEELGPSDAVGKPTRVELSGSDIQWGKIVFPKPQRYEQPGLGEAGPTPGSGATRGRSCCTPRGARPPRAGTSPPHGPSSRA